ncbi:MAG: TrkH family potassium uptake protein [Planctomycetota bacterium]
MRLVLVLGVIGYQLRLFSLAFVAPLGLAIYDAVAQGGTSSEVLGRAFDAGLPFAVASVASLLAGLYLSSFFVTTSVFRRSEALGIVSGTWLFIAIFGAIPYLFAGLSPVNSFFESMSGFTTTGATILTEWDYNRAFFLWRAMTQWFGGLGVIALFVVVLPRLGIAGRHLFFAEASTAAGDAVSPQIRESARRLWILYGGLTCVETLLLLWNGFPLYEAVVHSLTTLSAGGFSPHPKSIAGYANPGAEWVLVAFMIVSGTSFTLQYRAITGRPLAFFRDGEFLAYAVVILVATGGAALLLAGPTPDGDALRQGAFQVTSLISSTGYASADFNEWSYGLKALLIGVMLIGGCAGSACGGPKMVRYLLSAKFLGREVTQVLHPRAVIPLRYRRMPIPSEVMRAVLTLVALYVAGYVVVGILVVLIEPTMQGMDLVTGFSAALACFGNIGPAFGPAGPMGSYADFSSATKMVLAASMWIGRLEIVTVIALLHPHVWRNLRWRGDAPVPQKSN